MMSHAPCATPASSAPDDSALAPLLIDLLAWDEATPAAREALKRIGVKIIGVLVDALLDSVCDQPCRTIVKHLPASRPQIAIW
jgi:hypothetical protein